MIRCPRPRLALQLALALAVSVAPDVGRCDELRLARFSVDVTIPLGHRCMGILPTKAARVADPLFARGFALLGAGEPVVVCVVDWCEIRNDAYERWREALATAAGTRAERVLVSSVHQHDAPVVDLRAQRLLDEVGLERELCDATFHETSVRAAAHALTRAIERSVPVTHLGVGSGVARELASSRRVVEADGRVHFHRGSASGGDPVLRAAPVGRIDPLVRTISFWRDETPLVALHVLATHPMSHYGRGEVSADFVGIARRRLADENPGVLQIYASGASGDVTVGKHNDGSPENRTRLAHRLLEAMREALRTTRRHALDPESIALRVAPLSLAFHEGLEFRQEALERTLRDEVAPTAGRILAAMALSSRARLATPIELPALELGPAQIVLLPGESFVGFQLLAQSLRPDRFVVCLGYGECWPGYVPMESDFDEGFGESWRWVARGSEARLRAALAEAMGEVRREE